MKYNLLKENFENFKKCNKDVFDYIVPTNKYDIKSIENWLLNSKNIKEFLHNLEKVKREDLTLYLYDFFTQGLEKNKSSYEEIFDLIALFTIKKLTIPNSEKYAEDVGVKVSLIDTGFITFESQLAYLVDATLKEDLSLNTLENIFQIKLQNKDIFQTKLQNKNINRILIKSLKYLEAEILKIIYSPLFELNLRMKIYFSSGENVFIFNIFKNVIFEKELINKRKQFLKKPLKLNLNKYVIAYIKEFVTTEGIFVGLNIYSPEFTCNVVLELKTSKIIYYGTLAKETSPDDVEFLNKMIAKSYIKYLEEINKENENGTSSAIIHNNKHFNKSEDLSKKQILIPISLRNYKTIIHNRSEESEELAKQLCITLNPYQTLVREHTRNYNIKNN